MAGQIAELLKEAKEADRWGRPPPYRRDARLLNDVPVAPGLGKRAQ